MLVDAPQPLPVKACSQTAKRRARGCFRKHRSRSRYSCTAGYGLQTNAQATSCMPYSRDATAQQATRYFHSDHLGSISVITDEAGLVIERLAYDPWGKRRNSNGTADTQDSIVGLTLDRGFTEHEHLDEVGVIHMNGRIYDPLMGRFMSADPFIQAPFELQSHNRYSYVMNNPLFYTDPSGYSWWTSFRDNVAKPVAVIAVAVYTGYAIAGVYEGAAASAILNGGSAWTISGLGVSGTSADFAGAASGFAAGFTATTLYGGNLSDAAKNGVRSGTIGAATGGVMDYVGGATSDWGSAGRVAARASASGLLAIAQGGSFRDALRRTLLTATAAEIYTRFVGFDADPRPGENSKPYDPAMGGEQDQNTYAPDRETGKILEMDRRRNAYGKNAPLTGDDFMKQGGALSRAMNMVPGMNALAQFHDTIFNTKLLTFTDFNNWATMLPAGAITYGALIDRMPMLDRSRCPACFKK